MKLTKILSLALVVILFSTFSSGCKKEEIIAGTAAAGSVIGGLGEFFGFFKDVVTPVADAPSDDNSDYVEEAKTPAVAKSEEKNNAGDFPEPKYPDESAVEKTPLDKPADTSVKLDALKVAREESVTPDTGSSDTKSAELTDNADRNILTPLVLNPPEKISSEPANEESVGRIYLGINELRDKTYNGEIYPVVYGLDNALNDPPIIKAGVGNGSILLSVNGQKLHSAEDFISAVSEIKFGEKFKLEYIPDIAPRNPKTVEVEPQYTKNIAGNEYIRTKDDDRGGYSFDRLRDAVIDKNNDVSNDVSGMYPRVRIYLNKSRFEIFVIENEGKSPRVKKLEKRKAKENIKNLELEEINANAFAAKWIDTSQRQDIIEKDFFVVDHYDMPWTYIVRYTYDDKTTDSDKAIALHMMESFQPPTFK